MAFLQTGGVMPRKLRVQYPGVMYYVMSRGDQRDDILMSNHSESAHPTIEE